MIYDTYNQTIIVYTVWLESGPPLKPRIVGSYLKQSDAERRINQIKPFLYPINYYIIETPLVMSSSVDAAAFRRLASDNRPTNGQEHGHALKTHYASDIPREAVLYPGPVDRLVPPRPLFLTDYPDDHTSDIYALSFGWKQYSKQTWRPE